MKEFWIVTLRFKDGTVVTAKADALYTLSKVIMDAYAQAIQANEFIDDLFTITIV